MITIKMKENDKIKAEKIRFNNLILDTVSPVEIQLNAMNYETAFDGNLYQDYEVGTVDGKTIDAESIRNLKKNMVKARINSCVYYNGQSYRRNGCLRDARFGYSKHSI